MAPLPRERARRRAAARGLALALALGVLLPACGTTVNPATGRREVLLMSEADERKVDEKQAEQIEAQVGLARDDELQRYVTRLGESLAACSPRQNVEYRFNVVEMDEPNAFALPGGSIYVSRGLVALANDESELANVLAHEIGHVAARHAAQRHAHASTFGLATLLGTLATGRSQGGKEDIGTGGVFAYSRNQEREADRIGQEIAACAGVDPSGMARFLRTLDRSVRVVQGYSPEAHYLSSHPATVERIAEASTRSEVDRLAGQGRVRAPVLGGGARDALPIAHTRGEYLRRIEGMPVERPAAEGVFVDQLFLHPELDFAVRFPHGWRVSNQNAAVVGVSPRGDTIALLELQGGGHDPKAAALEYQHESGSRLGNGVPVRIGALPGYRAEGVAQTPFGPVRGEVTWVVHGGRVYRLTTGVEPSRLARPGALLGFARSFRPLTAAERESITEVRLRIALAREGESLAALSARTRNEWDLLTTAVANAVPMDKPLAAGALVKVAVREPYRPAPPSAE